MSVRTLDLRLRLTPLFVPAVLLGILASLLICLIVFMRDGLLVAPIVLLPAVASTLLVRSIRRGRSV